ncbi:hypothetical protein Tco_1374521, partial [Tanacetum coccineum]
MNLLSFIRTPDPSKVRIGERQRGEDELQLLDTTVGRVVPLLPVAPARSDSELEASVDRLFDKGGSGTHVDQGDSAGGVGEQGADIQLVTKTADIVAEDVIPLQPRRHKKRKTIVANAGEPLHPPKRLRGDRETLRGLPSSAPVITNITIVTTTVDAATAVKEAPTRPYLFGVGSSSAGGTDPTPGGFLDVSGSDFLIG